MHLGIFEDTFYENFLPLTYTRPTYELRCGMTSFREKITRCFPTEKTFLFTRDYLIPTFRKKIPEHIINDPDRIDDDILLVNGCLIPDESLRKLIEKRIPQNTMGLQRQSIVFIYLKEKTARNLKDVFSEPLGTRFVRTIKAKAETVKLGRVNIIEFPWKIVDHNAEQIREDYSFLSRRESQGTIEKNVAIYGDIKNIYVGKDSFVEPCVVLDAREGPIYIGEKTYVQTPARITGPNYLGNNTIVYGAKLRRGCSVGDVCRVGGELEETIIQRYSNKYHEGFVGHAYFGEWVNIAAGTTTSDIKNTYGTIRVMIGKETVDTGEVKMGCFIADHAKTSIGTQIYAGKKMGVASHMHGFVAEDVPSFTIWAKSLGKEPVELYLNSAIETEKRVMSRRGIQQTREDIDLLKKIFKITADERKRAGVKRHKFKL